MDHGQSRNHARRLTNPRTPCKALVRRLTQTSALGFELGGQIHAQDINEFLHRWRQHAAFAVKNRERAGKLFPQKRYHRERTDLLFLLHGGVRHDRNSVIDLNRTLHGLDVVEFHDGFDLQLVITEDQIDRLARRDVGVEADKFLSHQIAWIDLLALRERVRGMGDQNQAVVAKWHRLDLPHFDRKGHQTEIDRVVQDVLVNEIRAAVFDADIDRGKILQEPFDVWRQLVQTDRVNRRYANRPANNLLHLLKFAQQLLILMQHLLRSIINALPLPRELKLLLTAVDKQRLEMPLHRPGLLTHRRLGDAINFSRLREALRFDEICEDFKVFDLHDTLDSKPCI